MRNILKNRDEKKVAAKRNISKELFEDSIVSSGVIDVQDASFTTYDKKEMISVKYDYATPFGLDDSIDSDNLLSTVTLVDSLETDFKIICMSEVKRQLTDNIEYFKLILENTTDEKRRNLLERHIDVMEFHNEERSISQFIEVENKYYDLMQRSAINMNLYLQTGDELVNNLSIRNNEME